jgi:hypothetical protein
MGDLLESEWDGCREWNVNVLKHLIRLQADAVFTTSTRFSKATGEVLPDSYVHAWRAFEKAGIEVIAIRDNPDLQTDAAACVELHGAAAPKCSRPRAEIYPNPNLVRELLNPPRNMRFIDLTDYFCTDTTCSAVVGNVMVYRHGNHVTATYARTLVPVLHRELLKTRAIPLLSAARQSPM